MHAIQTLILILGHCWKNEKVLYTYIYIYIYIHNTCIHMVSACFGDSRIHMVSQSVCLKYLYALIMFVCLTYPFGFKLRLSHVFIWSQQASACFPMS
jgi:hypothetical protein